ncbi:MAG: gliding motility protein GldC [Chitinophagales bacterium]
MGKTSEINFKISLDDKQIPEKIEWKASDSGKDYKETKSIMLSMWDHEDKNAMHIDLWTNDMRLDEMDAHFFQTLLTIADTYQRATKSEIVMPEMRKFCEALADKISAAEKAKNKK